MAIISHLMKRLLHLSLLPHWKRDLEDIGRLCICLWYNRLFCTSSSLSHFHFKRSLSLPDVGCMLPPDSLSPGTSGVIIMGSGGVS
jgi:hypothetical protein